MAVGESFYSYLLFFLFDLYDAHFVLAPPLADLDVAIDRKQGPEAVADILAILPKPEVAVAIVIDAIAVALALIDLAHILVTVGVGHRDETIVQLVLSIDEHTLVGTEDKLDATRGKAIRGIVVAAADKRRRLAQCDAKKQLVVAELADNLRPVAVDKHAVAVERAVTVDLPEILIRAVVDSLRGNVLYVVDVDMLERGRRNLVLHHRRLLRTGGTN